MGISTPAIKTPIILNYGTVGAQAKDELVLMSADDTHTLGVWVGAWTVADTNGQNTMASAGAAADYVVDCIYDASRKKLDKQFVSATELNANDYYIRVKPIGGLTFMMAEDGDTTPIPVASEKYYADLVVSDPATVDQSTVDNPFGGAIGTIQIDSSSVNASSSGLLVQLLGLAPTPANPAYSATAGSQRLFKVKVITAAAGQSQP